MRAVRLIGRIWPVIVLILVAASIGASFEIGTANSLNRQFIIVLAGASVMWEDPFVVLVAVISGLLVRNLFGAMAVALVVAVGEQFAVTNGFGDPMAGSFVLSRFVAALVDISAVGLFPLAWELITSRRRNSVANAQAT